MIDAAQKLRPQFLEESIELLAGIRQFLLAVEEGRQMTVGSLRKAYRCAHTLRGTSALVKLESVRRIARLLEDTLENQLQKKQVPGRPKVELLKRALATLEEQLDLVRNGLDVNSDDAPEMEEAFARLAPVSAESSTRTATTPPQSLPQVNERDQQTTGKDPVAVEAVEEVPMNVCCRFQIGHWDLYLPMIDMVEIAQLPEMVPLPLAPAHVRGLINLRGKVIPIIDLSYAWGTITADLSQCNVVIARTDEEDLGFLADRMPFLSPEFGGEFFDLARFVEEHGVNIPS